jgi:cytochrome c556
MSRAVPLSLIRRATAMVLFGYSAMLVCTADAMAAEDATSIKGVIEARQATFKKMGTAMKLIVDQLKTSAPDTASMTTAAQTISSSAQEQVHRFPEGSGRGGGTDTDALPYIWQERAKFDSLASQLITESKNLTMTMSGNDLTAIRAQVKVLGNVCGTCHRSYRAD